MSDVNKLDGKQCPFDPEQYKKKIEIDDIAPVGSFPWAMIKVYSGRQVHRKDWSAPDEYIYLVPGNGSDVAPEVKVRDKHGVVTSWQPTQDDMMSCDWVLLVIKPKPVECMLSFDLEVGVDPSWGKGTWGYSNNTSPTFGTLTNFQSSIGIGSVTQFHYFPDTYQNPDLVLVCSPPSPPNLQSKNLEVAVNGSIYNLGSSTNATNYLNYQSDGAKQLGDFLKQNVGNTTPIHFCFNWK